MSKEYSITSINSGLPQNLLMANIKSLSGESKAQIKPIGQYIILYADNILANSETFLNLSAVNFDYLIVSMYWSNLVNSTNNTDIVFRIYDSENVVGKIDVPANNLDGGIGFTDKPYPFDSNYRLSVTSEFLIDRLTFIIEPTIVLGKINVT